jgi:hypothetical protein
MPQPTTLPRAPTEIYVYLFIYLCLGWMADESEFISRDDRVFCFLQRQHRAVRPVQPHIQYGVLSGAVSSR